MIKIFRKTGKNAKVDTNSEGGASLIASTLLKYQSALAKGIHKRTDKFSRKSQILLLIVFCLSTITLSALLIFSSVRRSSPDLRVTSIRAPILPKQDPFKTLDTNSIHSIIRFRQYMDSLSRDSIGMRTFDSIRAAHPTLMDSVAMVEKLYRTRPKN